MADTSFEFGSSFATTLLALPPRSCDEVQREVATSRMASMPDLNVVPRPERIQTMAAWLQQNHVPYDADAGDYGVRAAWKKVKASMKETARQQREHAARGSADAPLRSSVQRTERRHAAREAADLISLNELLFYATCAGEGRCGSLPRLDPCAVCACARVSYIH